MFKYLVINTFFSLKINLLESMSQHCKSNNRLTDLYLVIHFNKVYNLYQLHLNLIPRCMGSLINFVDWHLWSHLCLGSLILRWPFSQKIHHQVIQLARHIETPHNWCLGDLYPTRNWKTTSNIKRLIKVVRWSLSHKDHTSDECLSLQRTKQTCVLKGFLHVL